MLEKLWKAMGIGSKDIVIAAPVAGECVPVSEVSDPTFGEEILGKGVAIKPTGGRVVSPVDGTIETMFDTGHAVSINSDSGVEVLVHVGLDTINLKGKHYTIHKKSGESVKKGDLLIEFDAEAIKAEGYDIITPVVICNSGDFATFVTSPGTVAEGAAIITMTK